MQELDTLTRKQKSDEQAYNRMKNQQAEHHRRRETLTEMLSSLNNRIKKVAFIWQSMVFMLKI
jgi:uncharacterized FlaG/YvyC family protein